MRNNSKRWNDVLEKMTYNYNTCFNSATKLLMILFSKQNVLMYDLKNKPLLKRWNKNEIWMIQKIKVVQKLLSA